MLRGFTSGLICRRIAFAIFGLFIFIYTAGFSIAGEKNPLDVFLDCQNDHDPAYALALQATYIEQEPPVITDIGDGEVMLHWTAPGDDGNQGRAAGYDIRYRPASYGSINSEQRWNSSIQVTGEPTPSPAGQTDSMLVSGLNGGEGYYFAIKSYDDVGNISGLSNSPYKVATDLGFNIHIQIQGWGTVEIYPEKAYYQAGETVILYANPATDWEFGGWTGDINSAANPIAFEVAMDYNLTATFTTDFIAGDANGDGRLLASDVTYLVMFFAGNVPAPNPYLAGDANGDCQVIGSDVTDLVNYFRMIAPLPVRGDCGGLSISTTIPTE
jgi:hypothetical protein